jgi:DNA polymerase-1
LAYRAYYALLKTPLTNSQGQSTGAVLGFANYLLRLIEEFKCPYIAVAMDSRAPTFRHEMYDKYKANRVEMPDDLKSQIPLIDRLIEAFKIGVQRFTGDERQGSHATYRAASADAGA